MIRQKMKEVIALHDRHLMASNLDDNLDEDQEIEFQTKELTQVGRYVVTLNSLCIFHYSFPVSLESVWRLHYTLWFIFLCIF
ncbi:unnamed protein product [Trichobilharzia regenti]|nr:unnamed protein product [Trichobilharzia regenti]